MSALLDLAARAEALSGPDRELDAVIAAACRLCAEKWPWAQGYPAWEGRADGRVYLEKGGPSFAAPAYTASLDAAMSLVPEGMFWAVAFGSTAESGKGPFWATAYDEAILKTKSDDDPDVPGKTAALALTSAALRARSAEFGNIGADGVQS